jgi:hypothetical protein
MSHLRTKTTNASAVINIRRILILALLLLFLTEMVCYSLNLYLAVSFYLPIFRAVVALVFVYAYLFGRLFIFDPRELIVEFDSFPFFKSMLNINMYPINQFSRSQIITYEFKKGFLYNKLVVTRRKSSKEDIVVSVKYPAFQKHIQTALEHQLAEIMEYNKQNPDPFVKH